MTGVKTKQFVILQILWSFGCPESLEIHRTGTQQYPDRAESTRLQTRVHQVGNTNGQINAALNQVNVMIRKINVQAQLRMLPASTTRTKFCISSN